MGVVLVALSGAAYAETTVKDGDDLIIDGQDYRLVSEDASSRGQISAYRRQQDLRLRRARESRFVGTDCRKERAVQLSRQRRKATACEMLRGRR